MPTASRAGPASVELRSWSSPRRRRASTACLVTMNVSLGHGGMLKRSASVQPGKSARGPRPRRSAPSGKAALTRSVRSQVELHDSRRCRHRRHSTYLRLELCRRPRTATRLLQHHRRSSRTYDQPRRSGRSPALTLKRDPPANLIRANRALIVVVVAVPRRAQALDPAHQPLSLHVRVRPRRLTRRPFRQEIGPAIMKFRDQQLRAQCCHSARPVRMPSMLERQVEHPSSRRPLLPTSVGHWARRSETLRLWDHAHRQTHRVSVQPVARGSVCRPQRHRRGGPSILAWSSASTALRRPSQPSHGRHHHYELPRPISRPDRLRLQLSPLLHVRMSTP